jgi:hypothetical protein
VRDIIERIARALEILADDARLRALDRIRDDPTPPATLAEGETRPDADAVDAMEGEILARMLGVDKGQPPG